MSTIVGDIWENRKYNGIKYVTDDYEFQTSGDNAGSGFTTILDTWEKEGWVRLELMADTNLNQVTLVLKL